MNRREYLKRNLNVLSTNGYKVYLLQIHRCSLSHYRFFGFYRNEYVSIVHIQEITRALDAHNNTAIANGIFYYCNFFIDKTKV